MLIVIQFSCKTMKEGVSIHREFKRVKEGKCYVRKVVNQLDQDFEPILSEQDEIVTHTDYLR